MWAFFCKIYIDGIDDVEALQNFLDKVREQVFLDVNVDLDVSKNYDFDPGARAESPYHFMRCSRFFADVSAVEEASEHIENFRSGVVRLVVLLRAQGWFVTVMGDCELENKVVEETGWNWTDESPDPPGKISSFR